VVRDWTPFQLSARERRVIRALAEALYDLRGDDEVALPHILGEVQAWLAAPDSVLRTGLRALLLVIELSPVRFGFGAHTMSRLPLGRRVRYLEVLDARTDSPLSIWKTLLGTAYFDHPTGAAEMGREPRETEGDVPRLRLGRSRRLPLPVVPSIARAS